MSSFVLSLSEPGTIRSVHGKSPPTHTNRKNQGHPAVIGDPPEPLTIDQPGFPRSDVSRNPGVGDTVHRFFEAVGSSRTDSTRLSRIEPLAEGTSCATRPPRALRADREPPLLA